MKVISFVPHKVCRRCIWNDFKRCGKDLCVRAKCIYNCGVPDMPVKDKETKKEGGAGGK